MESRPARSLRLLCLYLRDTTGTARRESAVIRERAPGPLESLLPHTAQQHPMIPSPSIRQVLSCVGLHECDPIFVQRIAVTARGEQRLAICRLKKANLVSRFAHHRLVTHQRIGTIPLRRNRDSSQAIELGGYRDTTFRRLKKSEEKYQFRKSASAVRKFSFARIESAEQIVTSERRCKRQLNSSSNCYKSPLIAAAKWIRLDLAKRPGNRDKERCRKNAGEVGLSGGSFICRSHHVQPVMAAKSHRRKKASIQLPREILLRLD